MDRLHVIYNAPFSFTSLLNWPFATAAFKAVDHVLAETANRAGARRKYGGHTCYTAIYMFLLYQVQANWASKN